MCHLTEESLPVRAQTLYAALCAEKQHFYKIKSQIRSAHALLYKQYIRIRREAMCSAWEKALTEGFYILRETGEQLARDIPCKGEQRYAAALQRLLYQILQDGKIPLTEQVVIEILSGADRAEELRESQFVFLPSALRCTMLFIAADACTGVHTPAESERLIRYAVQELSGMERLDFEQVIQTCSRVERLFLQDPAGVYPRMPAESRQYYRQVAARIARWSGEKESEAAAGILSRAKEAKTDRQRHIGYALLELDPARRKALRCGKAVLIGMWAAAVLLDFLLFRRHIAIAIFAYLPLVELCGRLFQGFAARRLPKRHLPRVKLEGKLPKTLMVLCTLLPAAENAQQLGEWMEMLYLSNRGENVYFCLLADFEEARRASMPGDEERLEAVKKTVETLNQKYGGAFCLFLRKRSYLKTQGSYAGWERKRGALLELGRFLRNGQGDALCWIGDQEKLSDTKYFFVLDADTCPDFDALPRLLSIAEHPLNRPEMDENTQAIKEGYGILTARMTAGFPDREKSIFANLLGGQAGFSAYRQEYADFYQDAFGCSVFCGKGLIDVTCLLKLPGRYLPEERILSHDVLEGAYLRVGMASDVELAEGCPENALSWFARLDRWTRGDWQNVVFLPGKLHRNGVWAKNPLGALARYQIFDNLRRSWTPVSAVLCVMLSAFTDEKTVWLCALAAGGYLFLPAFCSFWGIVSRKVRGWVAGRKIIWRRGIFLRGLLLLVWELVSLAQQAVVLEGAMLRACWRMLVSGRGLLEWTSAAHSERRMQAGPLFRASWIGLAIGLALILFSQNVAARVWGWLWILYLPAAYFLAKPQVQKKQALDADAQEKIRGWCAGMFRYYEGFAGEENHFLPPDNVQFFPQYAQARRTSPTNIGMMLLSYLAARDLGLWDSAALAERLERVLDTLGELKTYAGNLYNWYSTETLEVLPDGFISFVDSGNYLCALAALREGLREYEPEEPRLQACGETIEKILKTTDLSVFYDPKAKLFATGITKDGIQSQSHYDFLMSEARTACYYAVAYRQVPLEHWTALRRTAAGHAGKAGLLSWTGTMFEYLMPHLLLPVWEGSALAESVSYAIECQKRQGKMRGEPWGVSESGYFGFDEAMNYLYQAHGVQAIGVKPRLSKERVIAPYACFLALPYAPKDAYENLCRMEEMGLCGEYGFYEAADFTPPRRGLGEYAIVRSFMAHHIGMSLVSCVNLLYNGAMQKRFMHSPQLNAAKSLLQEKIPVEMEVRENMNMPNDRKEPSCDRKAVPHSPEGQPACMLLSGGGLSGFFTNTGAGWLRYRGADLTRRPEGLADGAQGIYAIARIGGRTLSPTMTPLFLRESGTRYACEENGGGICYRVSQELFSVSQEISLRQDLPVASCQIRVENQSHTKAVAEIFLYFEPVLSGYQEYRAHPAFSKLFVAGEREENSRTLQFSRKNRDGSAGPALAAGFLEPYEYAYTLRRESVTPYPEGLGNLAFFHLAHMDGAGTAPDGCCAIKLSLTVPSAASRTATLLIAAGKTAKEASEHLLKSRGQEYPAARPAFSRDTLAAQLGSRLLPFLLFPLEYGAKQTDALQENFCGQAGLTAMGIPAEGPMVLYDWEKLPDRDSLLAYLQFWRLMRLHRMGFTLCVLSSAPIPIRLPKQVRQIQAGQVSQEQLVLLRAAACMAIDGSIQDGQQASLRFPEGWLHPQAAQIPQSEGRLDVVGGSFSGERFYVKRVTPLPFSHVLANETFGCLCADSGLGNSWWKNAYFGRVTGWCNDIAKGPSGEKMLLRTKAGVYDLCNGSLASFSPENARYEGTAGEIAFRLEVAVAPDCGKKELTLWLENTGDMQEETAAAYFLEPVMGTFREQAKYIHLEQEGGCLILFNPYQAELHFYAAVYTPGDYPTYATDKQAFYSGDWSAGTLGCHADPAVGVVLKKSLPPHGETMFRFVLACADSREEAVLSAHGAPPGDPAKRNPVLRQIQISTPSPQLDRLFNGFLPHQITAGRMWGRCGFYQCSGAYGFRDQLQDAAACLPFAPQLAKEQVLRCCAVQFREGDVLHWWHELPQGAQGVRTRFSDDLVWLPYLAALYDKSTGDEALLHCQVNWLEGDMLNPGESERYGIYHPAQETASVYTHCVKALEKAFSLGEHGIPKIGCGDWNDGFSNVGAGGKGESVWLGMFLAMMFERFAPLCERFGDMHRAATFRGNAAMLRERIDANGWDGYWYLRAFYDDGSPMGSSRDAECRIDLLPQSFAVFCGMPDQGRVQLALESALGHLLDEKGKLVRLFWPPFLSHTPSPGYIQAYPAGIRENGGQYTHAAVWLALALLEADRPDDGWKVLEMLNPVWRCGNRDWARAYKLEPYYIAADIYTHPNAYGHGGWSIYTGAAGWYYRAVVEGLFGLAFLPGRVECRPRLPQDWQQVGICICEGKAKLAITIRRKGEKSLLIDGAPAASADQIPLDGESHEILLTI